ncbi:antitoxin family protein [Aliterella atlantica]|uniref:DUF104 domain-containing protein n=1 Tax=Aliterella atlantica CENA595 TaxID=1618023 RepID=A0A0D8ZMB3_9CYAN|nr:antitoxin family protein [Aliterella atlantica]KJH69875.1 hypothetical protein UH38_21305 [Aliterella atlantica CENA595]
MSKTITAVYSNGVLHPEDPLPLKDGQTVLIQVLQVLTDETASSIEEVIQSLVAAGIVTPPSRRDDIEPVSEEACRELAQRLGQYSGKPLSEIIIEERGSI